jgi:hypothetical protein
LAVETYLRGAEWLMSAGYYNRRLYADSQFCQLLSNSGMPQRLVQLLLIFGQQNNAWFFPSQHEMSSNPDAIAVAYTRAVRQLAEAINVEESSTQPQG